ncbi:uncharacterized protein JCM6883_000061 [Sporobolomyces salmoneus]|uniref:uncharacterized protein n=1 Tax=Sporobolomyces salmoneus TaxID=183962 RepID=UPI00317E744A
MQPYRFPRSQGSLDLTDPNLPTATSSSSLSTSSPEMQQQPRPSFVITNATPQDGIFPQGSTDQEQHLARMTSATRTLLSSPSTQHLSINGPGAGNGKTLSRISEYSESAYSADGSSRPNSREPEPRPQAQTGLTPSASTSTNESSQNGTTPTTMSFSFPAPPAHSSPPAPTIPLPRIPPQSQPESQSRETVVSPSPWAYPALPGSPSRSHLPSRPITALTTPLPTSNPNPVPVPISNFVPHFHPGRADPRLNNNHESSTMVQIPGRAVTDPRASYHHSQPSDSTAWTMEGKYSIDKDPYGGVYDAVSIAPSAGGGGESNHRFTLDNNEKSPSRLGNVLPVKKGANRTLWWIFGILAVIGIALGVGLGVGLKGLNKETENDDGVVGVGSASDGEGQPSQSRLLPTATTSSSDIFSSPSSRTGPSIAMINPDAFSTTFGYRIGSQTTVVPLSYTIPTSYFTREDGRIQFTQEVVLPSLGSQGGSFTSDLRFRVPDTATASPTSTMRRMREKRDSLNERRKSEFGKHQRNQRRH